MNTDPVPRDQDRRPVVAVDFDGTLTRRDTLRQFLFRVQPPMVLIKAFASHVPSIARSFRGDDERNHAKAVVFSDILGGMPRIDAEAAAIETAQAITEAMLKTDVVARIRWHQKEGHRVIVVSASFINYVAPVVGELGIDEVIATRWEVDPVTDRLTGRFEGANVRGQAKVDLLTDHLGGTCALEYAYGNSRGDVAMLAEAKNPVWIGRGTITEVPQSTR